MPPRQPSIEQLLHAAKRIQTAEEETKANLIRRFYEAAEEKLYDNAKTSRPHYSLIQRTGKHLPYGEQTVDGRRLLIGFYSFQEISKYDAPETFDTLDPDLPNNWRSQPITTRVTVKYDRPYIGNMIDTGTYYNEEFDAFRCSPDKIEWADEGEDGKTVWRELDPLRDTAEIEAIYDTIYY